MSTGQPVLFHEAPLVKSLPYSKLYAKNVLLKLENTQPSGSFKSRGLGNLVLHHHTHNAEGKPLHFFSSSGGNAGLAAAVAAMTLGYPCTVVVPESTKPLMRELISETGANVVVHGNFWGDADAHLRNDLLPAAQAQGVKAVYCHPYNDPLLWDGYAAIPAELKRAGVKPDAIVLAVGGGGLYTGIMQGLTSDPYFEGVSVITAETEGASKMAQSLASDHKVTLAAPHTIATTLAAYSVSDAAYAYAAASSPANPTYALTVTDAEAIAACVSFADSSRAIVEPACGAAIAALAKLVPGAKASSGRVLPENVTHEGAVIVLIVCGGSSYKLANLLHDTQV